MGGSCTRRWGLLGEGSRLTWTEVRGNLEGAQRVRGQALGVAEVPWTGEDGQSGRKLEDRGKGEPGGLFGDRDGPAV